MGMQGLSYQELLQLVELIKSSAQFREFRLRSGDLELELRRGGPDVANGHAAPPDGADPAGSIAPPPPEAAGSGAARPEAEATRSGPASRPAAPAASAAALPEGATVIRSPMVGTFYRAPEPGAAPFVAVGATVEPDTTVCIIEVMKLMSSIPARCRGRVTQILVDDGAAIEYGQPLIVIDPA